jgi:hypothetical protein
MGLKAKLIIASATVATTGGATGAVIGTNALANNAVVHHVGIEAYIFGGNLRVGEANSTAQLRVEQTKTSDWITPSLSFKKDGRACDYLFKLIAD